MTDNLENKLLLVTFPVDFGNNKLASALVDLFDGTVDLKVYPFIPDQWKQSPNSRGVRNKIIMKRALGSLSLQKAVRTANREGRKVLFHGISPALFAAPAVISKNSFIVTDWTRKLYEPLYQAKFSPLWLTWLHRRILMHQNTTFCLTGAVESEIILDYGIPQGKLQKAKFPFFKDLDLFTPSPERNDGKTKLLFVGGDLKRKGGDVLLDWFKRNESDSLELTIVTKDSVSNEIPNVTIRTDVDYGQPEHLALFSSHDVFVMPTLCDGYPSVLGEAASSGLAILTTKNALGGPEIVEQGVNGYIFDSQEELISSFNEIAGNNNLVRSMKEKSRQFMEREFTREVILKDYLDRIFSN